MSAFVVNEDLIKELAFAYVSWSKKYWYQIFDDEDSKIQEIADILYRENINSVNYRYNEDEPFEPIEFKPNDYRRVTSPFAIWKMISCLEYQSCETPSWEQTTAHRILSDMKALAMREVMDTYARKIETEVWDFSYSNPSYADLIT